MSLKDKSKKSRALAHKLIECEEYNDFAANRYYYSCFQKLLELAQTKLQYKKDDKESSSHVALIMFVEEEINKAMRDRKKGMKLLKARSMKPIYLALKSYRVKADYHNESLTNKDIENIKNKVELFDDQYQILNNEM